MIKLRKGFWLLLPSIFIAVFASPTRAATYTATSASDIFFDITESQVLTVRTYAWQNGIDSMLWLYNSSNQIIAANDDYFGLDSYISVQLQPGTYRLRTGVCCGNPERWYGTSYIVETNLEGFSTNPTTTTTSTTTSTTTTSSTTTTTSTTTTSSTTTTTTTVPETTTTELTVPETFLIPTTTVEEITTTLPVTTSSSIIDPTTTTSVLASTTSTNPTSTSTTTTSTTTTSTSTTTTSTTLPNVENNTIIEIKDNLSQNELVNIVTNLEVLKEISKDQAEEVFQSIDISQITDEEKVAIISAIQDAPVEVKEVFEEEINIYSAGFDNYVPIGSEITVAERRTLIAVASIATAVSITTAGGSQSPTGGSPRGSSPNQPSDSNTAFKKDEEEEEDEEEAPEIEGPEGGDEEDYSQNSIYKYTEDGVKKFSLWNFIKKFSRETAALAFTISSTVIVFATLSGETRKITLIATSFAFLVHYISVMLKNDE